MDRAEIHEVNKRHQVHYWLEHPDNCSKTNVSAINEAAKFWLKIDYFWHMPVFNFDLLSSSMTVLFTGNIAFSITGEIANFSENSGLYWHGSFYLFSGGILCDLLNTATPLLRFVSDSCILLGSPAGIHCWLKICSR